jgi:pyruvate,water dikinase
MPQHIAWLSQISRADEIVVGAKAADLGEMTQMGLPVPHGFVLNTTAYYAFLQLTGLRPKLEALLAQIDTSDTKQLQQLATTAQTLIRKATMPADLRDELLEAYHHLSAKDVFVAVRASLPESDAQAIALSQRALLNIIGAKTVIDSVQELWASLFSARSLYTRAEHGLGQLSGGMAVIVQRMIESEAAGMLFTIDPLADNNTTSIEAIWGLGEPMVSGVLSPDHYEVSRSDWKIKRKEIVRQEWQLARGEAKEHGSEVNFKLPVSAAWQRKQKLSDEQIVALAKMAARIEEHYGQPQDCEWALADHILYLVQTRPVTPLPIIREPLAAAPSTNKMPIPLLSGTAAAPGVISGPVRVLRSHQDVAKAKLGEVLVCQTTSPDYDMALQRAVAIITYKGSLSSHAAVMARQIGIPAVVEVGDGASLLQTGEMVTVDGDQGLIFAGQIQTSTQTATVTSGNANAHLASPNNLIEAAGQPISTATKIYVNLTEPSMAEAVAQQAVDGVGLLRAEYMLSRLGEHPHHLLQRGKGDVVTSTLYDGLMEVAKAFNPRPVLYRACDFTSHEYAQLEGGELFEIDEPNPLLGYRGAYRLTTDQEVFKLELAALRKARAYYKNIWLMIPFVRTPEELIQIKQLLAEEGLYRSSTFKLYMMIEVPSNIFLLDQFLGVGIDGISIGTNDLTQLMLGVDRNNPRVAALFDERNPAVLQAMEQVIRGALRHGVAASVCGQAPSVYPEIAQKLVSWGVSSISVSPEAASATRSLVAEAEYQTVRQARTKRSG